MTLLTANDPTSPGVTPVALAAKIAELTALEAADPTTFAEALADNIAEPLDIETAAFRSDDLAFKSLAAANYLIDRTNEVVRRHRRNSDKQRASIAFGHKVARERRILENIVGGIKARNGILPTAPNPRRRAQQRLWNEAMKGGPIPAGRWRELLDEEVEKDRARRKQAKRARRDMRRVIE